MINNELEEGLQTYFLVHGGKLRLKEEDVRALEIYIDIKGMKDVTKEELLQIFIRFLKETRGVYLMRYN